MHSPGEKIERWLRVRNVHGLSKLVETGLASHVGVTVEYQRGAFASASLSSGEVGTLISGIRKFLQHARAFGAEFGDHVPHLCALRRVHKSWVLTVPGEFRRLRTPVLLSPPLSLRSLQVTSRSRFCLLQFHCLLRPEHSGGATLWPVPPKVSATPAFLEWLVSESLRHDGWWCTRPANTSCPSVRGSPTSVAACLMFSPGVPSHSQSGPPPPEQHILLFKHFLKRVGLQSPRQAWRRRDRFLASHPRCAGAPKTWSVVQQKDARTIPAGRGLLSLHHLLPADTSARLDALVELAPVLLASAPLPPPTPTGSNSLRDLCFSLRCTIMDDPSGRPPAGGVARRRRERRLRAQLRHEQQTVRMVLATVTHHSFQVGTAHDGLRAQKTVTSTKEVEERVPHAGLRAQKAPPPGMRPGVLQDPAPQGRVGQHSGIGYELVLALDVPVLHMVEQPVDASALAFLEEIEANDLEDEYMKLVHAGFHKSPALKERMREVMRRREVLRQKGRGRKKKKRRKRRTPRTSSLPSRRPRRRLPRSPRPRPGPRCPASWSVWTRRTLCRVSMAALVVDSGICMCGRCARVAQRQCYGQTVQNSVLVPQLSFIGVASFVPQRQIPMVQTVQLTTEIPQMPFVFRWSMPLLCSSCGSQVVSSPYTAHCLVRLRIHAVRQFTEFSYFLRVLVDSGS